MFGLDISTAFSEGEKAEILATDLRNPNEKKKELLLLKQLLELGRFTPHIDCSYCVEDVTTAHEDVDTGRKMGNFGLTY